MKWNRCLWMLWVGFPTEEYIIYMKYFGFSIKTIYSLMKYKMLNVNVRYFR